MPFTTKGPSQSSRKNEVVSIMICMHFLDPVRSQQYIFLNLSIASREALVELGWIVRERLRMTVGHHGLFSMSCHEHRIRQVFVPKVKNFVIPSFDKRFLVLAHLGIPS